MNPSSLEEDLVRVARESQDFLTPRKSGFGNRKSAGSARRGDSMYSSDGDPNDAYDPDVILQLFVVVYQVGTLCSLR